MTRISWDPYQLQSESFSTLIGAETVCPTLSFPFLATCLIIISVLVIQNHSLRPGSDSQIVHRSLMFSLTTEAKIPLVATSNYSSNSILPSLSTMCVYHLPQVAPPTHYQAAAAVLSYHLPHTAAMAVWRLHLTTIYNHLISFLPYLHAISLPPSVTHVHLNPSLSHIIPQNSQLPRPRPRPRLRLPSLLPRHLHSIPRSRRTSHRGGS